MKLSSKTIVALALATAPFAAAAQQANTGIAVDVKGPGVTIDGVAAEPGVRLNVQPGTLIVSKGGEVMVNHIKCRIRVRAGARYTVLENTDACKLAGMGPTEKAPGATAKWWPYAAFGAVALAAVAGSSDGDSVPSSP